MEAVLPRNGAKIVKQPRRALQGDKEDRYGIIGSDGTLKRLLFVDRKNGKVYEEMDDDDDGDYEGRFSNTIKLGLVSLFLHVTIFNVPSEIFLIFLSGHNSRATLFFTLFLLQSLHSTASLALYHPLW